MNHCLLKRNENRFGILLMFHSFVSSATGIHQFTSIHLFDLFFQEREKEYEESLVQNTERVVRFK